MVEEDGAPKIKSGYNFIRNGKMWEVINRDTVTEWRCKDVFGNIEILPWQCIINPSLAIPQVSESPDDIFEQAEESAGVTAPPSNEAIAKLATDMTILNDWCKTAEAKLKAKVKEVEAMKLQLYDLLVATNHSQGWKFDNGINIAPVETETVFKAKGIEEDKVLGWLFTNGLGDLIKTTTHWKSLSNAVLAWQESEKDADGQTAPLPVIFNLQVKKTVHFRGNGAAQFLKKYHEENSPTNNL